MSAESNFVRFWTALADCIKLGESPVVADDELNTAPNSALNFVTSIV